MKDRTLVLVGLSLLLASACPFLDMSGREGPATGGILQVQGGGGTPLPHGCNNNEVVVNAVVCDGIVAQNCTDAQGQLPCESPLPAEDLHKVHSSEQDLLQTWRAVASGYRAGRLRGNRPATDLVLQLERRYLYLRVQTDWQRL